MIGVSINIGINAWIGVDIKIGRISGYGEHLDRSEC